MYEIWRTSANHKKLGGRNSRSLCLENKRETVVMDNINFHKKIEELISSVGCSIMFLRTYSPDLNPIEWFKIKHAIRKTASSFDNFADAILKVLVDVSDCLNLR